jgi:hypothetical protein
MKNIHFQILLVSITTFILFGFTDSLFFGIFLNEGMSSVFEKIGLTANNSDVMVGALSASVALVVATYIKKYNKQLFGELIEHPALDILGILVGTYLYIMVVREYRKLKL